MPSGHDITKHTDALKSHFSTNGSPVMIGGGMPFRTRSKTYPLCLGVLAYTILGLRINKTKVEYLILDPHYVGADNVASIKRGKWCAWKDKNLFKKNAFYNMVLAQRPKGI